MGLGQAGNPALRAWGVRRGGPDTEPWPKGFGYVRIPPAPSLTLIDPASNGSVNIPTRPSRNRHRRRHDAPFRLFAAAHGRIEHSVLIALLKLSSLTTIVGIRLTAAAGAGLFNSWRWAESRANPSLLSVPCIREICREVRQTGCVPRILASARNLGVVRLGEPGAPFLWRRREQGISMNGTASVMGTGWVELSDLRPVRPA
jgi:hypothetical protein